METSGTIRIKFKNKIIFVFNKSNSYPMVFGRQIIKDLLKLLKKYSVEQLIELFDQIELVDQIEKINRYAKRFNDFKKKCGIKDCTERRKAYDLEYQRGPL